MQASIRIYRFLLTICFLVLLNGCSTLSKTDDPNKHVSADPLEGFNRASYAFNDTADTYILRPVAKAYDTVLPKPAKTGIGNFFNNLGEPLNLINNLLQGKVDGALHSTYRFVVNSTIGLFGLFDVADRYQVEEKQEDFGQTLAAWGVKPGPYLVIPFLGPSNLRDGVGGLVGSFGISPINEVTDSEGARFGLYVLDIVDNRAQLLGVDEVLNKQLDPYMFLKTGFESARIRAIYDGDPPEQEDDFEF